MRILVGEAAKSNLTPNQLTELLMEKSRLNAGKSSVLGPILADALGSYMETTGLLRTSSPRHLLALGIGMGFYLNTFLKKNVVTLEETDAVQSSDVVVSPPPAD